ncbi:MAG: HD domain-containing protein [Patescibacteria group bacterium]
MDVKEAYNKYLIPPNLQKHMLRVAALSQICVENCDYPNIDMQSITTACLFHDMANIIKFDFDKPSLFKDEEKNTEYWKSVQKKFIQTYGTHIHTATLKIGKELGLSRKTLTLITNLEWRNTDTLLKKNFIESLICIYCDMRIGPFGILPLSQRLANLQTRNPTHDFELIHKSAYLLEKTLQKHIVINLDSITDSHINKRFGKLMTAQL